ncbi:hypothetical protein [Antrihabitans stalactiti]|uniref:Uncharacterized protein n=1 Tax=Antrihabitans stalactiti TaxID=2584121 RepID=A0A848KHS2_9NOCA|nr:hypothetical protein [Antrihabitans stalactiti]NMN97839.1 hypothetical protein [Antrihabitans stalactiti]
MSTTKELVAQLVAGELTIEQVAEALRSKTFRKISNEYPDETADPRVYDDDSFFWVGVAWDRQRIDDDQYDILSRAAGESTNES